MERKNGHVKKKVLGRGLSALLTATTPSAPPAGAGRDPGFLHVPLGKIRAGSLQPRRTFPPEALEELIASIREKGILQPVMVRPTADGYELVAGERRFRAAEAAGLATIPAVVRKMTDREALEAALVENVQRADLNAIELAEGYQRLAHDFSLSQEQVAERVGKDRATVSNTVRLLKLPPPVRQAVVDGRLSAGHARALLSAPLEHAAAICETVLRRGLSVRETERLCGAAGTRKAARRPAPPDAHRKSLEEDLSRRGGTRVRLRGTLKKGRIEIHYFSSEELDRLCNVLFDGR
ncbi:MAG: ParB/RepB/Spo0J family partition protein [Deltaproteobacteria bacterium]|nr:MAG: ParB/RepB/Spo0J family partition protein [Deltaproteobacteria bacterium]